MSPPHRKGCGTMDAPLTAAPCGPAIRAAVAAVPSRVAPTPRRRQDGGKPAYQVAPGLGSLHSRHGRSSTFPLTRGAPCESSLSMLEREDGDGSEPDQERP